MICDAREGRLFGEELLSLLNDLGRVGMIEATDMYSDGAL
jgi:hypothetical protein